MTRAPGPKGGLFLGSLGAFRADPLAFLARAAQDHGDIVRMRFGPITAHLINHPALVDHVLSRNVANYDKATRSADRIAATTGRSLLSADQTAWARHRRLIQPAFQPRAFDAIDVILDALIDQMFARWDKAGKIDIVDEMMQLVIAAAIRILFSSSIDPQRINAPLEILLADTWRRIEAPLDASLLSPRLHRPAFRRAVAQIDAIVINLIQTRRASIQRPDDVLTRLLDAHAAEGEAQLTDQELRDAAVTLLLAGHETTANAVSWAFIHARSPFRDADPAQIFAEAIRLYPSIWIIERHAIAADNIGGYDIPGGSSVMISPFLMHRRADFWPDPMRFDPARFAGDAPRPRDAYLPFGLGPHRCIGLHLARKIATHVITRVFDQYDLQSLPDQPIQINPGITLRHAQPHYLKVARR
ncbi:cytochrome P450 [Loktanella salsilacus]|uniref:cytochrome P450 n=1 Tax=Loktanella salsilacus TaxID=195913 RepID=UPI0037356AE5